LRTKTIDTQGDKVGKGKKTIDVTVQHLLEIFIDKVNTLSDRIDYLELANRVCAELKDKEDEDEDDDNYTAEREAFGFTGLAVRLDIIDYKLKEILNQFEILKARVP
jgi:hypothetical protein